MAEEKDLIARNVELARLLGELGIDISDYTPDPKTGLLTMEAFIKRAAQNLSLLQRIGGQGRTAGRERNAGRAGISLAKLTPKNMERYGPGAVEELWKTTLQMIRKASRASEPVTALPDKAWLFYFWPEEHITSAVAATPIERIRELVAQDRNAYIDVSHKVYAYKFHFPPLQGAKVDTVQMVRDGIAWLLDPATDEQPTNEDVIAEYFPEALKEEYPEEGDK